MKLQEVFDFLNGSGICVRSARLDGMRGLVTKSKDGYIILLDERLTDGARFTTLVHEALHIKLGHLDARSDELSEVEKEEEVRAAMQEIGLPVPSRLVI